MRVSFSAATWLGDGAVFRWVTGASPGHQRLVRRNIRRLSAGRHGQSVGMGDDRNVANPDRTRVDERPERDEQADEQPEVHPTRQRHVEPWPAVAPQVEQGDERWASDTR
jgi:hypothetical protein